ncbi:Uncharacterised protein [Vibrio cholerae]|uniref:hypothetical protein n=1 Tax=Vibrio cholerae TaxID=666 RepID=UPI00157BAABA|nr:hypothetical protein [Vibrio cholerae]EGR0593645.1 hypothetical protein [Vibrio cholerae]EJL6268226.1 hypothetical protein [Vibrio cholerae]EJX9126028.1 hypothetical protein [Vibrio cholerae]EJY0789356.1 hypothetical protein [Vibrio cholerae]ELT7571317.1 hypothetical protein [Vibrio cholerae]
MKPSLNIVNLEMLSHAFFNNDVKINKEIVTIRTIKEYKEKNIVQRQQCRNHFSPKLKPLKDSKIIQPLTKSILTDHLLLVPYRSFCLAVHTYIKSAQDLDNKSKKKAFYHIHHFYVEDDVAPNVWRGKLRGQINVVANIEKSSRFRTQTKFRTSVEGVSDIDSDD